MSTNFAKRLVWKHEYDVKLWRHKERTPNTNDHHVPEWNPPWKFSAYATGHADLHAQIVLTSISCFVLLIVAAHLWYISAAIYAICL